ncbi:MAG: hypothetical protein KIS73_23860 [Enhydrobacter sp.]|nr:hypothetical protein [Enhydrobacter sp.]
MWRVILFLVVAEIVGGWLLISVFDLSPLVAYVAITATLSALVATYILLAAPSDSD